MEKIKICVIGARSCSSGSLMQYLLQHPRVEISMLVSDQEGVDIQEIHPHLHGFFAGKTEKYDPRKIIQECDVVFLHKNHGEYEKTAELLDLALSMGKDVKFIDLSADFRLKDANLYKDWYKFTHNREDLLPKAVYGLTELYRDKIKNAKLIANPGCYPTAILLSLNPLLKSGFVNTDVDGIYIHAISGFSGAGKNTNINSAFNTSGNIMPYKIGHKHQHIPEIEQEISNILNKKIWVTFAPHMADFKFGILTTSYVKLKDGYNEEKIHSLYKEAYEDEPFMRLFKGYPEIKNVVGTNFCDVGISVDARTKLCVVMSAIDNIVKGAAGQAIQNMNLMCGFDETEGLPYGEAIKTRINLS